MAANISIRFDIVRFVSDCCNVDLLLISRSHRVLFSSQFISVRRFSFGREHKRSCTKCVLIMHTRLCRTEFRRQNSVVTFELNWNCYSCFLLLILIANGVAAGVQCARWRDTTTACNPFPLQFSINSLLRVFYCRFLSLRFFSALLFSFLQSFCLRLGLLLFSYSAYSCSAPKKVSIIGRKEKET